MRTALIALALTWAFFFEFIPPTKRVHIWSDIEGYHYPLLDYAHKSLWQGRLPLWDPSIYCGIPFAGNIQAGLFYPPNWLLYLVNARLPAHLTGPGPAVAGPGMRFTSVEILAIAHVWLLFLFTYWWLKERTSGWLPAALAAMGVACGGYMLSQLNHLGVICGYAWIPLGLWGMEQTNATGRWKYLWKVAVAGTLCLLAGYPPTMVALALTYVIYAVTFRLRLRMLPLTLAALACAAILSAVQILPLLDATGVKKSDAAFGAALPFGNGFWASMVMPNWFDQNRTSPDVQVGKGDYLYLGVPFLFGAFWLLRRAGRFRGAVPALVLAAGIIFIAHDPTDFFLRLGEKVPLVGDVLRRYNLVPGIVLASALLAASAIDDFLKRGHSGRILPRAVTLGWSALAVIWSVYLLVTNQFASGWNSAGYALATLALMALGLYLFRANPQTGTAVLIAVCVLSELQGFGANRRFNAVDENVDRFWRGDARLGGRTLQGLDDEAYHEMLKHPGYRAIVSEGPHPTDLRHYGLATLQGFDPFLSKLYIAGLEPFATFTTNRLFDVDPMNEEMLRRFGVRWIFMNNGSPVQAKLAADTRFRKLSPGTSFYVIYEFLHAQPAWRFPGEIRMTQWDPEKRSFEVSSENGGNFVLVEQFFPGWKASVDGKDTPVTLAERAFQSIAVPPGQHRVEFRYSPDSLWAGAGLSLVGLAGLGYVLRRC